MNHTYSIVPQPLVSPLYRTGDRSDFSHSSAPTSPQQLRRKNSFVKKHIRHKSSTPIHRPKFSLLHDQDIYPYPYFKPKGQNISCGLSCVAVSNSQGKCACYIVPSHTTVLSCQEHSQNDTQAEQAQRDVLETSQQESQIFVKVSVNQPSRTDFKISGEKRHRQVYPKKVDHETEEDNFLKYQPSDKENALSSGNNSEQGNSKYLRNTQLRTSIPNEKMLSSLDTMAIQHYNDSSGATKFKEKQILVKSTGMNREKDDTSEIDWEPEKGDSSKCELETEHHSPPAVNARSVEVQVSPSPQYRLRFLPVCGCTGAENEWEFCQCCFLLRLAGRWALSQCGLAILLLVWALLGAAAFHSTEGPHEDRQAQELNTARISLETELATELRLLGVLDTHNSVGTVLPLEPVWRETIGKFFRRYEDRMLAAVREGYGEGGGGGRIWSYAGCLLFAVSLLTTLGFGAPVPRTTLGRIAAVIFSAIGIPLHLLLVLNVGMLVAVKLQILSINWQRGTSLFDAMIICCCTYNTKKLQLSLPQTTCTSTPEIRRHGFGDSTDPATNLAHFTPPRWLKVFPAATIATYYITGVVVFGAARGRPFSDCLLFPLDFTASGGVGLTSSSVRTCYAIYLEGAVLLAAIAVSVWQVSATKGLTNLGLKLGLLTNS